MKFNLNGIWNLRCIKTGEEIPALVPGDITVDYYKAGKTDDPYMGMNYKAAKNIFERDYEYSRAFTAPAIKKGERALLKFYGIDLFSEIYLNGALLGKTENMFMHYEYDVTEHLKEQNELKVIMRSTAEKTKKIDASGYFACFNLERIFLRKAQCHFGWDWAPNLPGYGIWNDVLLEYVSERRIDNIRVSADSQGDFTLFTELNYNVRKEKFVEFAATDCLRYTIEREPGMGFEDAISVSVPVKGKKNFRSFKFENPRLWMPNGYGTPNLYAYKVELLCGKIVIDTYEGTFGFRSVKLVQRPISGDRMGFKLEVNGVDVFAKGSNWVPCECFTGTVQESKYETLISMARNANMNMLRVWGGGIYEKDVFYDLCDRYGIMVWQDFMFACSDIPENNAEFVKSVTEEGIFQVKRLRNHPSLVYWCGGNEKTGSFGLLKQYGDDLVDITLRGIVEHYDGTRPYVRQSPYGYSDIDNEPESGETHGSSLEVPALGSYDEFLRASFNKKISFSSECAVMGSCVPESYPRFIPQDELWPMGEVYYDRFCDNPYGADMRFVDVQKKMIKLLFCEESDLEEFALRAMAAQAESLKIEVQNARRKRAECGGIMNWMYDDIWPTGTWSVIDYYLQPKMAYYTLKREYAPFRAAVIPDGNGKFFGYLVNDTAVPVTAQIVTGCVGATGGRKKERSASVTVAACSAVELGEMRPDADMLYIEYKAGEYSGTAVTATKLYKDVNFVSNYSVTYGNCDNVNGRYELQLTFRAAEFARTVRIYAPDGAILTDNYFDMLPGETKTVTICSKTPFEKEDVTVSDYASEKISEGAA
ncbi:glycoside hydrolase family 2 protein [Pumilibacter intestinalis]|uniref:glycoside hydrolase family 2 protein n=1 Tax=Pumilibacter intestinalis TaxID=2941511 RepID=UPI0020411478|nr:glycoside hydrolase family 2 protein [Pumilibacter intestinalis]